MIKVCNNQRCLQDKYSFKTSTIKELINLIKKTNIRIDKFYKKNFLYYKIITKFNITNNISNIF